MLITLCTVVICLKYCLIDLLIHVYQYNNYSVCVNYKTKRYNLIKSNHLIIRDAVMLCIDLHNLNISHPLLMYVH